MGLWDGMGWDGEGLLRGGWWWLYGAKSWLLGSGYAVID